MNVERDLELAAGLLQPWIVEQGAPAGNRLDVVIAVTDLVPAVQALLDAKWGYLAAITGLDLGVEAGLLEVLYHFCERAAVLTLRVSLPRETAVVPTLCGVIPSAGFFERELGEMFGIVVDGAPNTDRLFLPDEWPSGVYPLRKDFQGGGN